MLNETFKFTINSIGNLDCEALVNQVLNATPYSDNSKPVVCNSNKASITTVRPAPVYPSARSGGSLKVQRDSLLRVILFGSFPFLLRLYLILWFAV